MNIRLVMAIRHAHASVFPDEATPEDIAGNIFYVPDDRLADMIEAYLETI